MRSLRTVLAGIAGGALLAGCSTHAARPSAGVSPVAVKVAVARMASVAPRQDLAGTLSAIHDSTIGASTPGRVVSVEVRVGDAVTAGEVLARVDTSQYAAELAGAQAGVSAAADGERAAQAALAQAQSRLRLAAVTAQRMSRLYAEGAISKQQRDQTQADLASAQAGVAQAQASLGAAAGSVEQAQAGVQAAGVPMRNAVITAPYSGTVTQKFVEPGAVVGAGSPIVAIAQMHDLELDVALPQDDAAALVPGAPLTVRVDALGDAPIPASVRAIVPSQNPALRSATVKIAVAPRPALLPGMFARVSISGPPRRGVTVPVAAVVTRAGQSGVFAVRGTAVSFVPVETAAGTDRTVEVQGVAPGTRVAVTAVSRLTDGAPVTVIR